MTRDNAMLIGTYTSLTRYCDIDFKCACGENVYNRNFRLLYENHAKCSACIAKQKIDRRTETCISRYNVPHASQTTETKTKQVATFRKNILEKKDSLAITHPELSKQWDFTKNIQTPEDFTAGSNEHVWWKCNEMDSCGCQHNFLSTIYSRAMGSGCPYCANTKICVHKSIRYTHPTVADQWHPTLNGGLLPEHVSRMSDNKVWWRCMKSCSQGCPHDFEATVGNRVNGSGCPFCCKPIKMHCVHTSLRMTHPQLMLEWHSSNELNPETIGAGSRKLAVWICKKGHTWRAAIYSRTGPGNGCPHCLYKTQSKLLEYLVPLFPETVTQYRPDWCKSPTTNRHLPFDFYIPSLRLIIELDGAQHFKQISNWDSCAITVKKDVYKMKCALKQGLSVLRILQEDVWVADDAWLDEKLKPHLVLTAHAKYIFIVEPKDESIFNEHMQLLETDSMPVLESDDDSDTASPENELCYD